jgi:uncharacterized protein (TIGR03437 family)
MNLAHSSILVLAAAAAVAQTPPAKYFTTTAAGFAPPSFNPVALKQYLGNLTPAYDPAGRLYYTNGAQVWRLNADGTDTLIAGTLGATKNLGDGGPATEAAIPRINNIGFDAAGNLYIFSTPFASNGNFPTIRKVSPLTQTISTVLVMNGFGSDLEVTGFAVDSAGNTYFAARSKSLAAQTGDSDNGFLFVCSPTGAVSPVVAEVNGNYMTVGGSYLYFWDGLGTKLINLASPGSPEVTVLPQSYGETTMAAAPDGTLYLGVYTNGFTGIAMLGLGEPTPTQIAGTGITGDSGDGGYASQAQINLEGMAVNPVTGDIAFSNAGGVIRVITKATGKIQTVVGLSHSGGDNGPAILAQFAGNGGSNEGDISTDAAGNLYLFDWAGDRIRKITPQGFITTIAGNGVYGDSGDGGPAVNATIWSNTGSLAADPQGNVYFANFGSSGNSPFTIRKVDVSGNINVVAGGGTMRVYSGVPATSIALDTGSADYLATDSVGNLYVCYDFQILKVDSSGTLTVVAGTGTSGFTSDGNNAAGSQIQGCNGITVDSAGDIIYADGQQLREIKAGVLRTIAGVEMPNAYYTNAITTGPVPALTTFLGSQGPASPLFDAEGNVYFADGNNQIGMVDTSGHLWLLAGVNNSVPESPSGGDGGDATLATFNSIDGLAWGPVVNGLPSIYVYDGGYVRQLSPYNPASPPPFVSVGGVVGAGGSVPAVAAAAPGGIESIFGGNFVAAADAHTVGTSDLVNGKIPTTLAGVCVSFGGVPAAMFGVYPNQLNVQTPSVPPGPVIVQVTTNCGRSNAVTSNLGAVAIENASPEFFSFKPDPVTGENPVAAINAVTFGYVGSTGLLAGVTFTPASGGEVVEAYGTGWGPTKPAFGTGVIPGAAAPLAQPYTVTFGGVPLPQSSILYAGASPCCAGLYQLDFTVPSSTPSGNQTLVITINGESSPPAAFLDVQ